ncbi:hypothetical protein [Aminobacter sp. HY435]|uniref:hypothetical protein n=1 Tax=Aminobacter sp. HY435 TaxID=2970917 RepID=UPI0022B94246|nr:hypothetical protein [Aminobacter sp. HY435]
MSAGGFMPDAAVIAGIRKDIEAYEAARKAASRAMLWRVPLYLGLLVALVIVLAMVLNFGADPFELWFSTLHLYLYLAGFVAAFAVYVLATNAGSNLQASLRAKLLPTAFGFVQDLKLRKAETPQSFARLPPEALGDHDGCQFDDVISGSYDGFAFELYEAALWRRSGRADVELFDGVIVAFDMNKPFAGVLVATVKTTAVMGFFREMFAGLEQVQSGSDNIDAAYDFRTDNVAAALPMVSGQMAQTLDWLNKVWPGAPARIAINGRDGFLLLPDKRDFFELPADTVAVDYKTHVEPMIADIATMLATASLVRKIGS